MSNLSTQRPMKWWHEAVIDDMLAFPLDTLAERGRRLGYSVPWLSTLINSDMFSAAYAARRAALSERLKDSLSHKLAKAADKHLDVMLERLETQRTNIPFADLAVSTTNVLDRLGFGPPKASPVQVNVQQNTLPPVSAELLSSAREKLRDQGKLLELAPAREARLRDGGEVDGA